MKLVSHIRRFKLGLIHTTALCCLISSSLPLRAQVGISSVGDESGFDRALGNETIKTIKLKKNSRILLTKEPPAPKKLLGLEGEMEGSGKHPLIDGNGRHSIRLDGDNSDLDFIRNIGFEHGRGAEPDGEGEEGKNNFGGGAFYIPGDLKNGIENSHFNSNNTDKSGGTIYVGGNFAGGLHNSQFTKNRADWGGGLYVQGNLAGGIINSHFENNEAKSGGGAIYVKGILAGGIIGSQFKENFAYEQFGGAVYAGTLTGGVIKSQFTDNKSGWSGAAIFVDNRFSGGIRESVFLRNQVMASSGGAIGVTNFEGDIEASRFEDNAASNQGGALHVYENFAGYIAGSIFKNNRAGQDGGAIYIADRMQGGIYQGSLFEGNKARRQGGALYAGAISGDIMESRFVDNETKEEGGAIYVDTSLTGNITGTVFEKNTALAGGAIYINSGKLDGTIEDSRFTDNIAVKDGGAIHAFKLTGGITASDFDNNAAGDSGGALYIWGTLKGGISGGSSFNDNSADISGGALYVDALRGGIEESYFSGNHAKKSGGAVHIDNVLGGGIHASEFEDNSAARGGAIYAASLKGGIEDSFFIDNAATKAGGAIYVRDLLKGHIRYSSFINNGAEDGGAIYAGDILEGNIAYSVFRDNYADYLGGAIFVKELDGKVKNSIFTGNSAAGWGGAIYMGGIFDSGIVSSIFIGNQASFDPERAPHGKEVDPMGLGGAIFTYSEGSGERIIENSIFLGNAARARNKADNYGGLGGAIFHNATFADGKPSVLTIGATNNARSIFYGNRSRQSGEAQDRANAIYLGNMGQDDRQTRVNIKTQGGNSVIFMFDPLESQGDGVVDGAGDHYGKLSVDLHKTGQGQWFLGGNSVMHGASSWSIDEGSLHLTQVDGVEAAITLKHQQEAGFYLGENGTIAGSGTIAARDITLSGMLDPSTLQKIGMGVDAISDETNIALGVDQTSHYGTLTLESRDGGTVILKDATYVVDIGDEENDLIIVKGDMTIEGGTIDVRSHVSIKDEASGLYKETSHVILQDEGKAQGQFERVRDDLAFWNAQLDYVDHQIIVNFVRDFDGATAGCVTSNQCHIGEVVKKLGDDHQIVEAIIDMNKQELGNAYNNLSGEIYASGRSALLGEDHLYRSLAQRMVQRSQNRDFCSSSLSTSSQSSLSPMWFSTFAHSGYHAGNNHAARLNITGNGIAIGLDRVDNKGLLGGFLLAHETMNLSNGVARNSHTNIESYVFGSYLAGEVADVHLSGGILYHLLDLQTERDIWLKGAKTSLVSTAKADYYGHKVQIFTEIAKDIDVSSSLTLSPYLQLSHNYLRTAKAQESGSAAMLDITANTDALFSSTIGLRGFYDVPTLMPLRLNGDFGWQHHFGTGQATGQHNFYLSSDLFDIEGIGLERDAIFVGAGLNAILSEAMSLGIGYQGQFGHGVSDHSAMMQMKVQF